MLKKVTILLCLLLALVWVSPGVAAGSDAILCAYEYSSVSGHWEGNVLVGVQKVHFVNHSFSEANNAYDVTATISSTPANVVASDPDVIIGDLPVGGDAWSQDTFELRVDMGNPSAPEEGFTWRVTYKDAAGIQHVLENVPEFCPGGHIPPDDDDMPPPPPELGIKVKNMTISWARDGARWSLLNKDIFTIWGRLELPDGMTSDDLAKKATLGITIGGESGSDTVALQERQLRRVKGEFWTYRGLTAGDDNLSIRTMVIWWAPDGNMAGKAGFFISGVLELPETVGIGTNPPEAMVTLNVGEPGDASPVGTQEITFKVYPRLNLWSYSARLANFAFDPSGTE